MRYRCFNGELAELKKRIESEERKHHAVSLDRKIAEELKDDQKILEASQKIEAIEMVLAALHAQLPVNS